MHDLDRRRARGSLHCPHVGTGPLYGPGLVRKSAQSHENQQVSALSQQPTQNRDPSQVNAVRLGWLALAMSAQQACAGHGAWSSHNGRPRITADLAPVSVGRHDRSCRARTAVLRSHRPHYASGGARLVARWSVSCAGDGDTRSLAACCWVSARSAASSACTPRVRWPPGREPSPL